MSRRQYPTVYTLRGLVDAVNSGSSAGLPDGRWVPARPLGWASWHTALRAAWLVWRGRADAVVWPGQPKIKHWPQDVGTPPTAEPKP